MRRKIEVLLYKIKMAILIGLVDIVFRIIAPIFMLFDLIKGTKPLQSPIEDPLLLISATQLAKKIRKEQVTVVQVVKAYIDRCKQVDVHLNAIVQDRFTDAIIEAHEWDQYIKSYSKSEEELQREFPMLGVPFTAKESIGAKGMKLTSGCIFRKNEKSLRDGKSVELLRKSGAILIAITNTPEMCYDIESSNFVTGRTKNPYNLNRSSGGSSGGEAALLSSAASVIGIGSDLAGSLRIPSMFCGIYSHKATPGYISIDGHYPDAEDSVIRQFLEIGPMTRYTEDLKFVLNVIGGPNIKRLKLDETVNLKNLKIYYQTNGVDTWVVNSVDNEIQNIIRKSVEHFKTDLGCEVNNIESTKLLDEMILVSLGSMCFEKNKPSILNLKNDPKKNRNPCIEFFKAMLLTSDFTSASMFVSSLMELNFMIPPSLINECRTEYDELHKKLKELLGDNGVLIYPTFPISAIQHYSSLRYSMDTCYSLLFTVLKFPSTQVPMGFNSKGLPIGFQVVAGPHQDRLCLAVAEYLENQFNGWIAPTPISI